MLDTLPDHVQVMRSWPRPLGMMQDIETDPFTACLMIGHHTGRASGAPPPMPSAPGPQQRRCCRIHR
ncbi:hypothetical protein IP70_13785 [alpha proteobacterium AAP38]|nr:hypothetical protein IP70_13785 [alpha proteobacterium AAP38]